MYVTRSPTGELRLVAQDRVDAYVLDLGRADIAVRRLELVVSPLESMFFALTTDVELDEAGFTDLIEAAMAQDVSATHALRPGEALPGGRSAARTAMSGTSTGPSGASSPPSSRPGCSP